MYQYITISLYQYINISIYQYINQPSNQPTNQPTTTNQPTNQPVIKAANFHFFSSWNQTLVKDATRQKCKCGQIPSKRMV